MNYDGLFITLEGLDGCGKTTQADLLQGRLNDHDYTVIRLQEPGGTPLGEQVRDILLNNKDLDISPLPELLLYETSRAQLVRSRIKPELKKGHIVITDRFSLSSVAYQGFGRRIDRDIVEQLNSMAQDGLQPDLTVLLQVTTEVALKRRSGNKWDRIEQEDLEFYRRVEEGYGQAIRNVPNSVVLDGELPKNRLHEKIYSQVEARLKVTD